MKKINSIIVLKNFRLTILQMLILACIGGVFAARAQTILYSTDFGTVANVNPTGWTFSGVGMNTSTNTSSSGYTGASGSVYLGEGNSTTFTNTAGNQQTLSPIGYSEAVLLTSSTGFSNIALSFGMRKSGAGYNTNATYTLDWSTNGTTYNPIVYTEATSGSWGLATGSGLLLPSGANNQANLYFRWSFNRTGTGSNFKIDDVAVTGNTTSVLPATVAFFSNDTTVSESASSANFFVRLISTSTASSAVTISVSALSNVSASDYTIAALTLTFAANAPVNSTYPVTVNLNNDAIAESAEYIITTFGNLQNANVSGISRFAFYIADNDKVIPSPSNALSLNLLSSFSNTVTGLNSAEIVAHDPTTQRLYIANSTGGKLDIVDFVNPSAPSLLFSIPITSYGNINGVAVFNGTVAVAIENTNPQDSGKVVFFNQNGVFISQVTVGMMPDMITFNNAGTKVITANEGEPNNAYTVDPDGSVSIISITNGVAALTQSNVAHATFTVYNGQEAALRAQGIRIYGLNANASKDIEPEYVTVSKDDSRAWVTLQENNAVAEINLTTNSVTAIRSLGTKDHSLLNNGLDASNVTKGINISNFPIKGMYLPDAIASYSVGGINYIITANEGDSRAYSGFSEEQRISGLNLDPTNFPLGAQMKNNSVLGRLNATNKTGDIDNDGDIDTLFVYGSRSFSIWNANTGVQVYDSKDDLELITSTNSYSVLFNVSNTNNTRKDRSDDKGPEPEGVTIGTIGANTYAFIALERIGGCMVYDVTNPLVPVFVTYANNRSLPSGGPDNGSEGIIFIPQSQSPNGQHIVITANEISSTLSIWGIAGCSAPISSSLSVSGPTANICSNNTPTLAVASNTNVSYQWSRNGIAISGATLNTVPVGLTGSYSVAITGSLNCSTSSILRTFSVNAAPMLTITGASAVCDGASVVQTISGASTYSWSNGPTTNTVSFSPTASTVYSVAGTGTNNCVSSTTSTITVNANPTLTINGGPVAICNGAAVSLTATGANSYVWSNGLITSSISVTPTASIVYSVIGTSTNNCVGISSRSITVNANPIITVNGGGATICDGAAVSLTATGANSYVWSNGSTTNSVSVTPTISTVYSVTGTNINNCVGSTTTAVTVNANPTVTINGGAVVICNGAVVSLTATGANTYAWSNGPQTSSVNFTPTASIVYSVTGTNSNNCVGSATRSITVNANPTLAINGGGATICNGAVVSLIATGANTYVWSNGPQTNSISVTPATSTVYLVTGTNANNCVGSASTAIIVNANPTVTINGGSAAICVGAVVNLSANGANNFVWSNGPVSNAVSVTPATTTVYSVTGSNINGCFGNASVQVTVNPLPVITINSSTAQVCNGQSVTLTAAGATTYSWNTTANTSVITVTPALNASYTVLGTNNNNCVNVATQSINVLPSPVLSFTSSSQLICAGQNATISVSGANSYLWSTGALVSQIVVTPTTNSSYTVTGTGTGNCSSTSFITQSVSACTSLNNLNNADNTYVIYPNPANNNIAVKFDSVSTVEIRIFNALGALLLTQTGYVSDSAINIESLSKGIYFISVSNGNTSVQKKIVVE